MKKQTIEQKRRQWQLMEALTGISDTLFCTLPSIKVRELLHKWNIPEFDRPFLSTWITEKVDSEIDSFIFRHIESDVSDFRVREEKVVDLYTDDLRADLFFNQIDVVLSYESFQNYMKI